MGREQVGAGTGDIDRASKRVVTPRRVLLFAVIAIAVTAVAILSRDDGGPTNNATGFNRPPYTEGIEVGQTYNYSLTTHCGIHKARIDGTWWKASPPLDDGQGNPPPGWDGGVFGVLEIVSEDKAVYTRNGLTATFVRDNLPGLTCL